MNFIVETNFGKLHLIFFSGKYLCTNSKFVGKNCNTLTCNSNIFCKIRKYWWQGYLSKNTNNFVLQLKLTYRYVHSNKFNR